MKKFIAAAAVVAAAAGSLLGFASHASAQEVCLNIAWSFPDPTQMLPVALPVSLPIPFSGSRAQCLSPSDLPVPNPGSLPVPGGLPTVP